MNDTMERQESTAVRGSEYFDYNARAYEGRRGDVRQSAPDYTRNFGYYQPQQQSAPITHAGTVITTDTTAITTAATITPMRAMPVMTTATARPKTKAARHIVRPSTIDITMKRPSRRLPYTTLLLTISTHIP